MQSDRFSKRSQGFWIGLGCQRGVSSGLVAAAIQQVCTAYHLDETLIIGIATLESKASETGILELCAKRRWILRGFLAAELRAVQVPNPAIGVMTAVATPSVAEAAAILAAQAPLCVCKQIICQPAQPRITLAVAQSQPEA